MKYILLFSCLSLLMISCSQNTLDTTDQIQQEALTSKEWFAVKRAYAEIQEFVKTGMQDLKLKQKNGEITMTEYVAGTRELREEMRNKSKDMKAIADVFYAKYPTTMTKLDGEFMLEELLTINY